MARRLGFAEVYDRAPALEPTPFGLAEAERLFADVRAAEARELAALRGATAADRG
jgi:hypothetical protein